MGRTQDNYLTITKMELNGMNLRLLCDISPCFKQLGINETLLCQRPLLQVHSVELSELWPSSQCVRKISPWAYCFLDCSDGSHLPFLIGGGRVQLIAALIYDKNK